MAKYNQEQTLEQIGNRNFIFPSAQNSGDLEVDNVWVYAPMVY